MSTRRKIISVLIVVLLYFVYISKVYALAIQHNSEEVIETAMQSNNFDKDFYATDELELSFKQFYIYRQLSQNISGCWGYLIDNKIILEESFVIDRKTENVGFFIKRIKDFEQELFIKFPKLKQEIGMLNNKKAQDSINTEQKEDKKNIIELIYDNELRRSAVSHLFVILSKYLRFTMSKTIKSRVKLMEKIEIDNNVLNKIIRMLISYVYVSKGRSNELGSLLFEIEKIDILNLINKTLQLDYQLKPETNEVIAQWIKDEFENIYNIKELRHKEIVELLFKLLKKHGKYINFFDSFEIKGERVLHVFLTNLINLAKEKPLLAKQILEKSNFSAVFYTKKLAYIGDNIFARIIKFGKLIVSDRLYRKIICWSLGEIGGVLSANNEGEINNYIKWIIMLEDILKQEIKKRINDLEQEEKRVKGIPGNKVDEFGKLIKNNEDKKLIDSLLKEKDDPFSMGEKKLNVSYIKIIKDNLKKQLKTNGNVLKNAEQILSAKINNKIIKNSLYYWRLALYDSFKLKNMIPFTLGDWKDVKYLPEKESCFEQTSSSIENICKEVLDKLYDKKYNVDERFKGIIDLRISIYKNMLKGIYGKVKKPNPIKLNFEYLFANKKDVENKIMPAYMMILSAMQNLKNQNIYIVYNKSEYDKKYLDKIKTLLKRLYELDIDTFLIEEIKFNKLKIKKILDLTQFKMPEKVQFKKYYNEVIEKQEIFSDKILCTILNQNIELKSNDFFSKDIFYNKKLICGHNKILLGRDISVDSFNEYKMMLNDIDEAFEILGTAV